MLNVQISYTALIEELSRLDMLPDRNRFARWRDADIDPSKLNMARVYDYWLRGTNNLTADRELAEAMATRDPYIPASCKANRAFLGRAVRYLAAHGIRQFLDIGSGIPTAGNVHEVAEQAEPESRVVTASADSHRAPWPGQAGLP